MAKGPAKFGGGLKEACRFLLVGGFCTALNAMVSSWVAGRILGCESGIPNLKGLWDRSLGTEV